MVKDENMQERNKIVVTRAAEIMRLKVNDESKIRRF